LAAETPEPIENGGVQDINVVKGSAVVIGQAMIYEKLQSESIPTDNSNTPVNKGFQKTMLNVTQSGSTNTIMDPGVLEVNFEEFSTDRSKNMATL
jgi:hypothetical protein